MIGGISLTPKTRSGFHALLIFRHSNTGLPSIFFTISSFSRSGLAKG
jgi:hypothetical protein